MYHVEPTAKQNPANSYDETAEPQPAANEEEALQGHLYIIDVSQSVEHDHPHAFDFLRSDLRNVEDFFSKRGVRCLGLRRAFEFVTTDGFPSEDSDAAALQSCLEQDEDPETSDMDREESTAEQLSQNRRSEAEDDAVFMQSYIPRTLNEVYDPERDVGALNRGERGKLIYEDTIGIIAPKETRVHFEEEEQANEEGEEQSDESDEEDSGDDGSEEGEDGVVKERKSRGHRHEDREAKKVTFLLPPNRALFVVGSDANC